MGIDGFPKRLQNRKVKASAQWREGKSASRQNLAAFPHGTFQDGIPGWRPPDGTAPLFSQNQEGLLELNR
jgi:hypothetical protein